MFGRCLKITKEKKPHEFNMLLTPKIMANKT